MKNKMLTIVGVLALALAIGLNVRHALNDYGVKDGKLHVEVLAQTSGSGSGSSGGGSNADKEGPKTVVDVSCEISGTFTRSNTTGQNGATQWNFGGNLKVGSNVAPFAFSTSVDYSKSAESSNLNTATGSFSYTKKISGKADMCKKTSTEKCTPWDPCDAELANLMGM